MKRLGALLGAAALMLAVFAGVALADGTLSAEGTIVVMDKTTERWIRDTNSCTVDITDLRGNEYYAFAFWVRNNGNSVYPIKSVYARINGGDKLGWAVDHLDPKENARFHIYYSNMGKLSPGTYKVDFYVNDQVIGSQYFTIRKDWSAVMNLPSATQRANTKTGSRSPYITCYPDFPGISGYTQFSVDFKADYTPPGTYLSVCNWGLDLSPLKRQYQKVEQVLSGYCGFQVLEDGTRVAILSLWDVFCTDKKGNQVALRPTLTYPSQPYRGGHHGEAGGGANCLVKYDWKEGRPYRALVQLGTSGTTGNTVVEFWVMDLVTMEWTRLCEFDSGVPSTHMTWCCAFLENYITRTAGEIRTMELSNIRVYSTAGKWVAAKSVTFDVNNSYDALAYGGSYSFGSDGKSFWAITTGVPNCVKAPTQKSFKVTQYETGSPF